MDQEGEFDIAFAGGGCAALSLLYRMSFDPAFRNQRILLADPLEKVGNDRTWCFWEQSQGPFESIVKASWQTAAVMGPAGNGDLALSPYSYKMIRSSDFYQLVAERLKEFPKLVRLTSFITEVNSEGEGLVLKTKEGEQVYTRWLFDSRFFPPSPRQGEFYLHQHFRGWFIRTEKPEFDVNRAVLMDLSIPQGNECRFFYVLPTSSTEALVEFTFFSEKVWQESEYEPFIQNYIVENLGITRFEVVEKEFGVIPMYSEEMPDRPAPGIIRIGSAGGRSKASTGYTFTRIQRHSEKIMESWKNTGRPDRYSDGSWRHHYFDRVLLHVLARQGDLGARIFSGLFHRNGAARVFRFLDEDGTVWQDYRMINTVPIHRFILPGIQQLVPMLRPGKRSTSKKLT